MSPIFYTLLWIVLIFAVSATVGYFFKYTDWHGDRVRGKLVGAGTGAIVAVFITIGFFAITGIFMVKAGPRVVHSESLKSISLGTNMHGSFFLASGSFSQDPSFTYYHNENGGYVLSQQPASESTVVYTTGQPRVEWTCLNKNWWAYRFGLAMPDTCQITTYDPVVFYVPTGSIANNYQLNLGK